VRRAPILSPSFRWHSSATHATSDAFRARQRARMRQAQERPANVTPLKERKHAT
jgi:hypothetical protein